MSAWHLTYYMLIRLSGHVQTSQPFDMQSRCKPTILLVPGAFTTGSCYNSLVSLLHQKDYKTLVASLPSSNPPDPKTCSAQQDGEHLVQEYLQPLLDTGNDVLVYAHSYGATSLGFTGSSLSKRERQACGKHGGVIGLVYMAFAPVPAGESQLAFVGNQWPPFAKLDKVSCH